MQNINIKKIWLLIYIFLAIFEPPILPFPLIYLMGGVTVFLLIFKYGLTIPLKIINKSGMKKLLYFFFAMLCYLMIVNAIDFLFIESIDLVSNRLKCINQLIVLTVIEILEIWYIFQVSDELNFKLEDLFKMIFISGALQGICSITAYFVPSVRSFFVRFGDSALFNNAYFLERRGYGFSMTLIDTFGYGMGLIAGYILLLKWNKKKIWKIIALALTIFSIFVNARTGIVIFSIAIILKVLQGENKGKQLLKIVIAMPIIYLAIYKFIPIAFKAGIKSTNITIKWVAMDMQELYTSLLYGESTGTTLSNASFFSNFGNLPSNVFEFMLGSGHSIYDTTNKLGFRTDIGYINLWWEFGIVGMLVLLGGIFVWMAKAFLAWRDVYIKSIVILNIISFFIVLFKAILIGYNTGVFVNYLTISAITYYSSKTGYNYRTKGD